MLHLFLVLSHLKSAIITPILKEPGVNPLNFDNFHPISNLQFISKIVEKCIAVQIHEHLSNNNLYEQFQSGFRPHSTETAFVRRTQPILTPKVSPNSLPLDVHNSDCLLTFKTRLKTCLFIEAFYNMLY